MAKQPESKLQKKIQDALKKEWPKSFWFKMWGGPFTPAGIPDLIGCVDGVYIGLEVKLPNKSSSKPSAIQIATIKRINRAGGHAQIVRSVEEALHAVYTALEESAASL